MVETSIEREGEHVDDFSDLHNLSMSQVFGSLSQPLSQSQPHASSYYGDNDGMVTAPKCVTTSESTLANLEPLVSTQTSTATEASSTTVAASQTSLEAGTKSTVLETSCSETTTSTSLGKRKASDRLGSEPSSPRRKAPCIASLPEPIRVAEPTFQARRPTLADRDRPIVVSPPLIMAPMVSKIAYDAQWELARQVSLGLVQYNDLNVQEILAINAEPPNNAPPAARMFNLIKSKRAGRADALPETNDNDDQFGGPFEKEFRAQDTSRELEKEDKALSNSPYGAMGYKEDGHPAGWYGGQVVFRGTVHTSLVDSSGFTLKLEKPIRGPSSQLTRRFGSKHFIRLRLGKQAKKENGKAYEWLRNPFVICGSVFRSFYAKEENVFLVKTNEVWDGTTVHPGLKTEDGVMPFLDFIQWFNPLKENFAQPMAKWASRFSLGLSASVPGFRLDPKQIVLKEDIVNDTNANMTDGAGNLNRTLSRYLRHHYNLEELPSAFQVRVYGSKGLLVEDASDYSEEPRISLTPSQRKIIYSEPGHDPSKFAIDILRTSHLKSPCRLSTEIIVNLAENGVSQAAFVTLLQNSLEEMVHPFFDWDSDGALPRMWQTLQRRGGVIAARRARQQPEIARLNGWSERGTEENEVDDGEQSTEQRSIAWWPDVTSGCPSGLEETCMLLLDAGFTPQDCWVLRDKLKKIVQIYVDRETRAYRVEVPKSATGFIVPDWTGTLEEGEVFLKSSERNLELLDGTCSNILTGDVLLARHPCKLPTDVRKWKAVDQPALHNLVDVIVLSTKGKRRAADWLAGGDYDGDKAIIIWQEELVSEFENAPEHHADEPANISQCFDLKIETVPLFTKRIDNLSQTEQIREMQHYLLGAVRVRSVVGQYSNCHEVATYTRGYADPETRRLAFMFCLALDGAKSGMTVKSSVFKRDNEKYGLRSPLWKEWKEGKDQEDAHARAGSSNMPHPKRKPGAGVFIMDSLKREAEKLRDHWGLQIDEVFNAVIDQEDPVLAAPYREMIEKIKGPGGNFYRRDLDLIEEHVRKERECDADRAKNHSDERNAARAVGHHSPRKSPNKLKQSAFTERPIEERQDILRAASSRFARSPDPKTLHMTEEQVERVKASFAYIYDCYYKRGCTWDSSTKVVRCSRFPFNVAFRTLCDLKAKSKGNHKTLCSQFYEHAVIKPPRRT